ncbi:hypothetical protein HOLleu_02834 [Holothuria leucospilota]|uniref:Uncharacterized protein n=1 Tax=Holothuria leucospilota TaxID=206669 RepID=A0A9Q1HLJ7_HOLLE|nr:hypothetical protein HOLleu_02834 [Holothuria leucospilota]
MDHQQQELASGASDEICILCRDSLRNGQPTVKIQQARAVRTFNEASEARGTPSLQVSEGQEVHTLCRQIHIDRRKIATAKRKASGENMPAQPPRLCARTPECSFKEHCFLCGTKILTTERKNRDYFLVRTYDFQKSIIQACDVRGDDDSWAEDVRHRIINAIDLPATDALYHHVCSVHFRSKNLSIPLRYQQSDGRERSVSKPGRRSDVSREEAFFKVVDDLTQDDEEQTTVTDLVRKVSQITPDAYSPKYMRQKLEQHLGDSVVIADINGRPDVVTIRTKAAKILQTFHDTPSTDENQLKQQIVNAAADLVCNEIKCIQTSKETYPDSNKLSSLEDNLDYVPGLLRTFLDRVLTGKTKDLKVATLGQCIVQMTRPRIVLAPIPLGLGVQMHHQYGSRFLIDSLNNHGLCVSYSEVLNFESSAACFKGTGNPVAGHFGQYIPDNVDHNLRTLDGRGTVHAMGIIMTMTPGMPKKKVAIPRLTNLLTAGGLEDNKIAIRYYRYLKGKSLPLVFRKLPLVEIANEQHGKLDTLWKVSWSFRPRSPGWSGMMQALRKGDHPGKSSVHFLPMLDLDPSDMTCIYSTLHFVATESNRQGTVPVVTFDQSLWWKSRTIILNEDAASILKPIVLILGGFHTAMSYLGSIGHIMEGSGLKETLELVYAGNAVEHIFFRREDFQDTSDDLREALKCCDAFLAEEMTDGMVCQQDVFDRIKEKMRAEKERLSEFPTGNLWVQYMGMVDLQKTFLGSQRTGDFQLYLRCLQDMDPYLEAYGHNHYVKSVQIHLQDMLELIETNPDVYNRFSSGLFVIRRSDRFWAELPSDLVIEQALMRTIKTTGGATYSTSDQHKDLFLARKERDHKDTYEIFQYLNDYSPFVSEEGALRSVATGVTASASCNPHEARKVGEAILDKMMGQNAFDFVFRRKEQIERMGLKQVVVDGEKLKIDPQLLFQRLLILANNSDYSLDDLLKYELSAQPTALFDKHGLLLQANKPQLADALPSTSSNEVQQTRGSKPVYNVLDGEDMYELTFRSDKAVKPDKNTKIREWQINALQTSLGEKLCYLLPIIHAIGGCDTTSRLYGIGKRLLLKKAMSNTSFAKQLEQVLDCSTREEMKTSGEKVLAELYEGKNTVKIRDYVMT